MALGFDRGFVEILLVQPTLEDARQTYPAFVSWETRHSLTIFRNSSEAIEFLRRGRIYARAPRPDVVLVDRDVPTSQRRELESVLVDEELVNVPLVLIDENSPRPSYEQVSIGKPVKLHDFLTLANHRGWDWKTELACNQSPYELLQEESSEFALT